MDVDALDYLTPFPPQEIPDEPLPTAVPPTLSFKVSVLEGAAYKNLKRFVLEVECTARLELTNARKKAKKKGEAPPKNSFVFFKDVMEKVPTKTGYHWELTP